MLNEKMNGESQKDRETAVARKRAGQRAVAQLAHYNLLSFDEDEVRDTCVLSVSVSVSVCVSLSLSLDVYCVCVVRVVLVSLCLSLSLCLARTLSGTP